MWILKRGNGKLSSEYAKATLIKADNVYKELQKKPTTLPPNLLNLFEKRLCYTLINVVNAQ